MILVIVTIYFSGFLCYSISKDNKNKTFSLAFFRKSFHEKFI